METTTVKLTIGNETKAVEATVTKYPFYTGVSVRGLKVKTTQGGQMHDATALFIFKDSGEYNINEAHDIRYVGMRGNGHAKKSSFRYIGF